MDKLFVYFPTYVILNLQVDVPDGPEPDHVRGGSSPQARRRSGRWTQGCSTSPRQTLAILIYKIKNFFCLNRKIFTIFSGRTSKKISYLLSDADKLF